MSSNVIPFEKPVAPIQPPLKCSFCGRPETAVNSMVSNALQGDCLRAICKECLEKAKARLEESR